MISYMLHVMHGVFVADIIMPQMLVIAVFISAVHTPLPIAIIVIISVLYDYLLTGAIGVNAIPMLICYHVLLQYSELRLHKQTNLVRCVAFFFFLCAYSLVHNVLLYSVLLRTANIQFGFILLQFLITWSVQPFVYLLVNYIYSRLRDGL